MIIDTFPFFPTADVTFTIAEVGDPKFIYFNYQKQYLRTISFAQNPMISNFDMMGGPMALNFDMMGNVVPGETDSSTLLAHLNERVAQVKELEKELANMKGKEKKKWRKRKE